MRVVREGVVKLYDVDILFWMFSAMLASSALLVSWHHERNG